MENKILSYRSFYKKNHIYLISFIYLVLFSTSAIHADTGHRYVLRQQYHPIPALGVHVDDLNYDQRDELILKVPQQNASCGLRIYTSDLPTFFSYQKNFRKDISLIRTFNWDGKGFKEIFLVERDEQMINLLIISAENPDDTLFFFPLISLKRFGDPVRIKTIQFADLNSDGAAEAVVAINSGLNPKIRAVWAVDMKNRQVLWKFPLATNIRNLEFLPDSGLEFPLLLISTQATCNGYAVSGMDDCHSYAIVLNGLNGECIFKKELSEYFSFTQVLYLRDHHPPNPLLLTLTGIQAAREALEGKVIKWELPSGQMVKQLKNYRLEEIIQLADVTGDGMDDIIRSGKDDRIVIYDRNLEELKTFQFPGRLLRVKQIMDLDHDGELEYLVGSDNSTTLMINNEGEILAEVDFTGEIYPVANGPDDNDKIAIWDVTARQLRLFELSTDLVAVSTHNPIYLFGGIAGLLLVVLSGLLGLRAGKDRLPLGGNQDFLDHIKSPFVLTDKNGKIKICNREFENLMGIKRSEVENQPISFLFKLLGKEKEPRVHRDREVWPNKKYEIVVNTSEKIKVINLHISKLWHQNKFSGYCLTAEDVTDSEHYQKSISWAAMAQRLAHEIKNPLTTVKLSLQRLKMEYEQEPHPKKSKYDKYVDSSLEEVIRLRTVAENFMKFCRIERPNLKNIQLNELIKDIIAKYQMVLPEEQIIDFIPEKELPEIRGDADQLETAVGNLIDNAIKATHPKGHIELRTHHIQKINQNNSDQYILLEIEDTGVGIPSDKLEKIFQPYVSGELNGSGIGLAIVQRIINDHHGKITIKSRESAGTLVLVELPVFNPQNHFRG